jgi:hypothetical protein
LDNQDVTSAATVTPTATGASVNYQSPTLWAVNSVHAIALNFADNASPPNVQTNQWTFTVANLPTLPAAWGTAPGSAGPTVSSNWPRRRTTRRRNSQTRSPAPSSTERQAEWIR